MAQLRLFSPTGLPRDMPEGADLGTLIVQALAADNEALRDGDVLVLAQKIVSKAQARRVALDSVQPGAAAQELAAATGKDARLVELILRESNEVLRSRPGVIVVEHRLGFVMANAGIDQSNVPQDKAETALLLPLDPDGTCAALREQLRQLSGADVAVLVIDSHGRAWRKGTVGVAIGAAGLPALLDLRGQPDLYGRALRTTEVGLADEIAAAASLLMGQADEGRPVVVLRGLPYARRDGRASELVRERQLDLFR